MSICTKSLMTVLKDKYLKKKKCRRNNGHFSEVTINSSFFTVTIEIDNLV